MAEPRVMLTMQDAARIAQVDVRTVMRWTKPVTDPDTGEVTMPAKLKAVKRGNVTRIKAEDWEAFWDGEEHTP